MYMTTFNIKKQLGVSQQMDKLKQLSRLGFTLFMSFMVMGVILSTPVHAKNPANTVANNVIDITFKNGSYCGNFSGDLYNGRLFSLWLNKNQELIIRNIGNDQLSIAYVVGANGRLVAERYHKVSSFLTQAKGKHVVKIYATSPNSSVEFCAS